MLGPLERKMDGVRKLLVDLYPEPEKIYELISEGVANLNQKIPSSGQSIFNENTNILVTYPGQFLNENKAPLELLKEFLTQEMNSIFSHVHILPFHPWSSDDGFSCINFNEVEPKYGAWNHLKNLGTPLMVDCVFNHISCQSDCFQQALKGDEDAKEMFHFFSKEQVEDEEFQKMLKLVVRPRTSKLLTPYEVNGKTEYVWTTFGPDQVDLNLSNPEVMKFLVTSLFNYIECGARLLRIDAVPFFWKEIGTSCSHHKNTHNVVKLFRAIVDQLNFEVNLITESNVPHHENITYWGDGEDEAHAIYNFSLAPLILHALTFETNRHLVEWGSLVFNNSPSTTFINFTSTHDGIGMRGLEGLVSESDINELCNIAKLKGGRVGEKVTRYGTIRPYELNITWASFLDDKTLPEDDNRRKLVNSHALPMFFPGLNTQYIHNFFGTYNWEDGVKDSGIARRINRKPLTYPTEMSERAKKVQNELLDWIKIKNNFSVFAPQAKIRMRNHNPNVLSFERFDKEEHKNVHFNLTPGPMTIYSDGNNIELKPYELVVV